MIALCGALTFAELGRMYHASGAQYEILRDSYGPLPAFLFVFCNATAIQAGAIGIIALVCARNLLLAVAESPEAAMPAAPGRELGLCGDARPCCSLPRTSSASAGGADPEPDRLREGPDAPVHRRPGCDPGAGGRCSRRRFPPGRRRSGARERRARPLVPALFSFGGWQHALWISGEVREPRRNLPRAIVGGVGLVIVVYLLANWSYLRLLGSRAWPASKTLAASAVAAVLPAAQRA